MRDGNMRLFYYQIRDFYSYELVRNLDIIRPSTITKRCRLDDEKLRA